MTEYEAHWLWYDFSNIAGSAVMRSKNVDIDDPHIDWDKQEQAVRTAALSFACAIFETLDLKGNSDHIKTLFHLRNAVLHNSGNISQNTGHPKPLEHCDNYYKNSKWADVFTNEVEKKRSYFEIKDGKSVSIEAPIFRFVERLLDGYLTDDERKTPPPKINLK